MNDFGKFYHWYLRYFQSKDENTATIFDKFMALSYAVRTHIIDQWIETQNIYRHNSIRRVYVLSLDHSFGRNLYRNIVEVGMENEIDNITNFLKADFDEICDCEPPFELGNCPKGTISQSFHETMASQGIPAMGYGLWYDFGEFRQKIKDYKQVEYPYNWKHELHPWNINRPEYSYKIQFGGTLEYNNLGEIEWISGNEVVATPWDYPVVGYKNGIVNTVRFWEAISTGSFSSNYYNHGDYSRACSEKYNSTDVTRFLYPEGDVKQTTDLRIKQQYFLAAASLKDIVRRYKAENKDIRKINEKVLIQISDSKSAIAVIEMLRILIYDEKLKFIEAIEIIKKLFIFSSAALEYDDLERWPIYLLEEVLPLHSKIILDLNHYFLNYYRENFNISDEEAREISIIEEGTVKKVRIAYIAVLSAMYISGMSEYQTSILKNDLFKTIAKYNNSKFLSGFHGISIRRSLIVNNIQLTNIINEKIGTSWIGHNLDLIKLTNYTNDEGFKEKIIQHKENSKLGLAKIFKQKFHAEVNSKSMVFMQCRTIHPSHRQSLQLFYIIERYLRLLSGEELLPRTYIIGGRAAPTNYLGKQLIQLINIISEIINNDERVKNKLALFFIPNCGVDTLEELIPAVDFSEHLAYKDTTPYGMDIVKYTVNGVIPVFGSSEADNEIKKLLGSKCSFTFDENSSDDKQSFQIVEETEILTKIFEFIELNLPKYKDGESIYPLLSTLRYNDEYNTINTYIEYSKMEEAIDKLYSNRDLRAEWIIHNIAYSGRGSLDQIVHSLYSKGLDI